MKEMGKQTPSFGKEYNPKFFRIVKFSKFSDIKRIDSLAFWVFIGRGGGQLIHVHFQLFWNKRELAETI